MRARPVLLALLALALVLLAAPAGAAEPTRHSNCMPKGAKAFAASERLRVFSVRDRAGRSNGYACDLLDGKRRRLWRSSGATSYAISKVRFARTAAAYELRRCSKASCSLSVASVEVRFGRTRAAEVPIGPVHDIAVGSGGATAFIAGGSQPVVVRIDQEDRAEELDRGALVQPGSLALAARGQLYWMNGALPRRAQLTDATAPTGLGPTAFGGHERCYPKRSHTEAASTRIRVYSRTSADEAEEVYTACDLRSGRRTELKRLYPDQESYGIGPVATAGPALAFSWGYAAKAYYQETGGMRSLDVSTGTHGFGSPAIGHGWASVQSLVLEPDGSVGWITDARTYHGDPTPGPFVVRRCDARGCLQLEEGDDVDGSSMALASGSQLYWTRDGQPRAATLE
jgi:hypothetical protein